MNNRIESEALDWVIRLAQPDFGDWDEFEAWLAADPEHGEAYWPMAERDRTIAAALINSPQGEAAPNVTHIARYRKGSRWSLAGWPMAASLLVAVGGFGLLHRTPDEQMIIATKPGATRAVELPDGSQIVLNGSTSLILDRENPNRVRLDHGQASFSIRHNPGRPFTLSVGDASVLDVGTRFDVVRDKGETRIAVAEGAIRYERAHHAETIAGGQTITIADGSEVARIGRIDPAFVSGWRMHTLVYDRAPVATVVADLERSTGVEISVSPDIASRAYTGTLSTGGRPTDVVQRFAAMADIQARRRGDGWFLSRR